MPLVKICLRSYLLSCCVPKTYKYGVLLSNDCTLLSSDTDFLSQLHNSNYNIFMKRVNSAETSGGGRELKNG
jgi:hypothetical protein